MRLMAPRERFELSRREDSGFRIHRNTGLCDLGCSPSTVTFAISLTSLNVEARTRVIFVQVNPCNFLSFHHGKQTSRHFSGIVNG
jgi:hypothetical protein